MPVAIAGMHRSGTSLVARLLNRCGLDLGPEDQLMKPAPDNPEGFWESLPFVHINERVIGEFGNGSWHAPPPPDTDWEGCERLDVLRDWAARLPTELNLKEPWGWKDPRNSLTHRFWRSVWPQLWLVVCVRNPLEVANSLLDRDGLSYLAALRLWRRYHEGLLDAPGVVVTHYDSYFVDPEAELRRVTAALGMTTGAETCRSACAAIVGSLRHSRLSSVDLARAEAPADVIELYRRLCAQAGPVFVEGPAGDKPPTVVAAARLAIKYELRGEELATRIHGLEAELRQTAFDRDEARIYGADREYWVRILTARLAARRHRYADTVAELVHKVARPGQPRPTANDVPDFPPPWGGAPAPAPEVTSPLSTRS